MMTNNYWLNRREDREMQQIDRVFGFTTDQQIEMELTKLKIAEIRQEIVQELYGLSLDSFLTANEIREAHGL